LKSPNQQCFGDFSFYKKLLQKLSGLRIFDAMSWMVFFFWFAMFLWAIIKLPFFQKSGVKPLALSFVFVLKVIAGIGLTLVYTYYYPDRSTADIYKYFDDAQIIASTLPENPQLYAEFISGINDTDPQLETYVKQMKNWSAHSDQWLSYTQTRDFNIFNSNRIITRFNALLWPISLGNMYTHVLFMCFLSLFGLTAFFVRWLEALLSSLCEDGVGGFLMLEYQKLSPTHPDLTQLRTAVMVPENFTHTRS
jgi:hypothetical protein